MSTPVGEAFVELSLKFDEFKKSFEDIKKFFKEGLGEMDKKADDTKKKFLGIFDKKDWETATKVLKGLGITFGIVEGVRKVKAAIMGSITSFAEWEFAMAGVKAKAFATNEEFQKMQDLTRELGTTTRYSAIEAAEAMKVLVEMGLTASQALGALPSIITLATTESMELAHAADIAIGSMRGLNMEITDLQRINDALAYTAAKSASTIYSLGQALKVAGPAAHASGQSLEDILAVIGGLANRMIRSEAAGYAMTQMMARITRAAATMTMAVDETGSSLSRSRKTLMSLGIEVIDPLTRKMRPLPLIFKELRDRGITTAETLNLFGVYTYKTALAAIGAADEIMNLKDSLESLDGVIKNASDRMAAIQMDSLKGEYLKAKAATTGLGIAFGALFGDEARTAVEIYTASINALTSALEKMERVSKDAKEAREKTGLPDLSKSAIFNSMSVNPTTFASNGIREQFLGALKDGWKTFTSLLLTGDMPLKVEIKPIEENVYKKYWSPSGKEPSVRIPEYINPLQKFSGPFAGKATQFEREDTMKMKQNLDAQEKAMKKIYSMMKSGSVDEIQFELGLWTEQYVDLKILALQYIDDKQTADREAVRLSVLYLDEKQKKYAEIEAKYAIERIQKEEKLNKLYIQGKVDIITEGAKKINAPGEQAEAKLNQANARQAESYHRMVDGMKADSKEYFEFYYRYLEEQRDKELIIQNSSAEGRIAVEKWYIEQVRQLHYKEVERSTDFAGGMKVALQRMHDEGPQFGKIGGEWVNDLKSGFQSSFSTFFSDTLKGTKSWGEAIKGLFTNILGGILDSFADAAAKMLANSLFNMLLGSFMTKGMTTGVGTFSGTSAGYTSLGGTPWYNPKLGPNVKGPSNRSNNSEGITVHQAFNLTVTANDAQSVQQFFKKHGKIVQELAADGVNKSRRLKKLYRGDN